MSNNPGVFSELERAQIRYHMGYLQTNPVISQQLGTPALSQESFIVDGAITRVRSESMGIVRRLLQACEETENNILAAQRRLKAKQVGNITLRDDECDRLEYEYDRWTNRLAEALGSPRNPYSTRFRGKPGINVPVVPA